MHYKADELFAQLAEHCGKYQSDNSLLNAYLQQEQQERVEIRHSPKELNNNAVVSYERGKHEEALSFFSQAFRIMPKNANIALNLLQVMLDTKHRSLTSINTQLLSKAVETVKHAKLDNEQQKRFAKLEPLISAAL